jgi:tetratricopeptide (TPR) repeat protein
MHNTFVDLANGPANIKQRLIDLMDLGVERSGDPALAHADRGIVYSKLKEYENADVDFAKAVEINPRHAHAWDAWGRSFRTRGLSLEAREKYTQAIEAEPDNWLYIMDRGKVNFELQYFEEALSDFTKVLQLYPTFRAALSARCDSYLELAQFAEARADQEELRQAKTSGHHAQYQTALLSLMLGSADDYQNSCRAMLEQFGETEVPAPANLVAWSCALAPDAVEDYEPVIALATQAVDAQSDIDAFLSTLGAILYRAGRQDEAIEPLQEVDLRREVADEDNVRSSQLVLSDDGSSYGGRRGAGPRVFEQSESVDGRGAS